MKSSAALLSFYKAYAAWIADGAQSDEFSRKTGLCSNCFDFFVDYDAETFDYNEGMNIAQELHLQFARAGLNASLPFNYDLEQYGDEVASAACHGNMQRLRWVNARIKDMEG